jgi:hypothetical protein
MRSGNGLWSIRAGMSVRPMFAAARSPLKGFGSRSKSGSLDMLTAIRRASSRVSRFVDRSTVRIILEVRALARSHRGR